MKKNSQFHVDLDSLSDEVTGSCHVCKVKFPDGEMVKFLVDCGLFQEQDYTSYNDELPFDCSKVSFIAVTHAHTDHIGRLPLAVRLGFKGNIYCSRLTRVFMKHSLADSAQIIKRNAKRNKVNPLYDVGHVSNVLDLVNECMYETEIQVHEHITLTFFDNGHIPGATMILVKISYPKCKDINLFFTGDYSSKNTFFDVKDISNYVRKMPLTIIQESTYGTTDSCEAEEVFVDNLRKAIKDFKRTIIYPVFSLDRGQTVLYTIRKAQEEGKIPKEIPVYLDGTLFICYTRIYLNNSSLFKKEIKDFLPYTVGYIEDKSVREYVSKYDKGQKIILTSSGMGSYGPAPYHIRNNIELYNTLIHFTGYPAEGTASRRLKDAPMGSTVIVGGEEKKRLCDIEYTSEFSSHARRDDILEFLDKFKNIKNVLVNHGSFECKEGLATDILDFDLAENVSIENRNKFHRIYSDGTLEQHPSLYYTSSYNSISNCEPSDLVEIKVVG